MSKQYKTLKENSSVFFLHSKSFLLDQSMVNKGKRGSSGVVVVKSDIILQYGFVDL